MPPKTRCSSFSFKDNKLILLCNKQNTELPQSFSNNQNTKNQRVFWKGKIINAML